MCLEHSLQGLSVPAPAWGLINDVIENFARWVEQGNRHRAPEGDDSVKGKLPSFGNLVDIRRQEVKRSEYKE